MRVNQETFAAGEVDPGIWSRVDTAFIDKGLSYGLNVIVKKTGGIVKVGGLEYVADAADDDRLSRLIPFDFGLDQSYVIELAHEKARFIRDGALVGAPTEVVTPYQEEELFDIGYASAGDITNLCHLNYSPRELQRLSDTNWQLVASAFEPIQEAPTSPSATYSTGGTATRASFFKVTAVGADSGEESLPTSQFQESATSGTGTLALAWTAAANAGRYRVYKDPSGSGVFGFIGETLTNAFTDTGFDPDETDAPPTARNPFGSTGNYPEVVTYHQGRKWYGSTENDPSIFEASRSGLFSNFSRSEPLKATDSISGNVTSRTVNRIRHLVPLRSLLILTTGGSFVFSGPDNIVTATSENSLEPQAEKRGSSAIPPVIIGNAGIFVLRNGQTVRDIGYAFADDAYVGTELSAPSGHLFEGVTIVSMAYAESPDSVIYVVLSDGTGLALTYMREHEVFGWTRIETDGWLEDVAVAEEGSYSAPYFKVRRTIGGQTKRFIERMRERDTSSVAANFYVDCGLSYSGAPSTVISGLGHLEGREVVALADGDVVRGLTVTSGAVTLPRAASVVHVGLEKPMHGRTLPLGQMTPNGSIAHRQRRAQQMSARVWRTPSFEARQYPTDPNAQNVQWEKVSPYQPENWGDPATVTSTRVDVQLDGVWDYDCMVEFRSNDPVHFEMQAASFNVEVGE